MAAPLLQLGNNANFTPRPTLGRNNERNRMISKSIRHEPFVNTKNTVFNIVKVLKSAKNEKTVGLGTMSYAKIIDINGVKYILRETKVKSEDIKKSLENEIDIYKILQKDPNYKNYISNLLYADVPLYLDNSAYFIFEYKDGTTLDAFAEEKKNSLNYIQIQTIINHLKEALQFIHSKGIVHRDIKPDNIFIDKSLVPLIFDFDTSCRSGKDCESSDFVGTRKYATNGAKVILNKTANPYAKYTYNENYDLYSLGIIIQEDLVKLAKPEDKEKVKQDGIALCEEKRQYGGRIGVLNPWWGGKCGCQQLPKLPIPMGILKGGYRPTKKNLKYLKLWKQGKSIGFTMRSSLKAKGLIPRANGTRRVSNKYKRF